MYITIHEYHFVFINTPVTLLILLYLYDADCCDTVLMYVIYLHGLFVVETAVFGFIRISRRDCELSRSWYVCV